MRSRKTTMASKHRKTKKKKNIVLIIFLSILALLLVAVAGGYIYLKSMIKPPTISGVPIVSEQMEEHSDMPPDTMRIKGVYNILLIGRDKVALNTDTIFIVSMDTENDKVNLLSVPRDTMSNVSRTGSSKKINAAYSVGGKANIEQLKKEIKYLVGFDVDRYVVVNLEAFEEIIDAIGGVTIDVKRNMNYDDPYQDLHIHLKKGVQTLNGEDAMGFVRFRQYPEGDLARIEAQQQFMTALADKLMQPAIVTKLPELAKIVTSNMDTDLTLSEIVWFAQEATEIDLNQNMATYTLPGVAKYVNALSYFLPDEAETLALVNAHFNPYDKPITKLNMVDISKLRTSDSPSGSSSGNGSAAKQDKDEADEGQPAASGSGTASGGNPPANAGNGQNNGPDNDSGDSSGPESNGHQSSGETVMVPDANGVLHEVDLETGEIVSTPGTVAPPAGDAGQAQQPPEGGAPVQAPESGVVTEPVQQPEQPQPPENTAPQEINGVPAQ